MIAEEFFLTLVAFKTCPYKFPLSEDEVGWVQISQFLSAKLKVRWFHPKCTFQSRLV